jgi:hypothetical protein
MSLHTHQTFPALIRYLISFPPEIIHQILNDLPISKVLGLAVYDVEYINSCILAHLSLQKLFPSSTHLSTASSYFKLYTDVYHRRVPALHVTPVSSTLKKTFATSDLDLTYDSIIRQFHTSVAEALHAVDHRVTLLASFSPTPLPKVWDDSTLSSLVQRWISLNHAQRVLNGLKSSQLKRLAELMTAHPHTLKAAMDPSQERRQNPGHVVGSLHMQANNILRMQVIDRRDHTRNFRELPLIPYNRYLRLFLDVIKRYPPLEITVTVGPETAPSTDGNSACDNRTVKGGGTSSKAPESVRPTNEENMDESSFTRTKISFGRKSDAHYPYPDAVVRDIVKAVEGLPYVYTSATPHQVSREPLMRTQYTPYSAPRFRSAHGLHQPMFISSPGAKRELLEIEPLCERELEWLTAFLDACKFMSGMDAKWKSGETVAQMWKRKSH